MYKFKIGDRVIYEIKEFLGGIRTHNATILSTAPDDPQYGKMYKVEFEEKDLIPPEMEVPEDRLKANKNAYQWMGHPVSSTHGHRKITVDPKTHCPKCGDRWVVTESVTTFYYDCKRCNLKREDYSDE